jgi:hypothetical protein
MFFSSISGSITRFGHFLALDIESLDKRSVPGLSMSKMLRANLEKTPRVARFVEGVHRDAASQTTFEEAQRRVHFETARRSAAPNLG